jgi:competence protein ComEA
MNWIKNNITYIIGGVVVVLLIVGFVSAPQNNTTVIKEPENTIVEEQKEYIYVDLKGAIIYPGVYKVEKGTRLYMVVNQAGGFKDDADVNAVNLSITLQDEDVFYFPRVDEEYPNIGIETEKENSTLININTASILELETLPGIGPSTAQSIIDYREEHGTFTSIDDIMNVSGIGESTFENIKEFITN